MHGQGEHLCATLLSHFNENQGSFRNRQVGHIWRTPKTRTERQ